MKYLVLVPDGAADYPQEELGGRTPLQAARTPHMDRLARQGRGGLVQVIPADRPPGSDVGNLEVFGYDTCRHYTGRAPLEAASMGVELPAGAVAFRCNLVTCEGDVLVDYSAGHLSTEEGRELIGLLAEELGREAIAFHPGVGYRHLLVWRGGPEDLVTYPPHDIMGASVQAHLPSGDGEGRLRQLMRAAGPILAEAEVNRQRQHAGKRLANAIWPWGSGRALALEPFAARRGLRGGVISAVDLVRGIGRAAGMEIIPVPGITGYLDTNYAGKAEHALGALQRLDLVYVHVEAPDEAAHNGDPQAKVQALEDFDRLVVGRLLEGLAVLGPARVLLVPDHRTPIQARTHTREPVPFVLWGTGLRPTGMATFDERAAEATGVWLCRGHHLMDELLAGGPP
ncbi:MAG: cofactor-independent phosphoglycerate mutase [Candidatus Latescibacterota bacterium]